MTSRTSDVLRKARNTFMLRRPTALVGGLAAITLAFAGTQADAQSVQFGYVGGRWSHARHAGWNRYWGGPAIGFYYAPTPVYVVPGYASPSYYEGPDFWTSNPSFGISLNFGGGGYYDGGYYRSRPSYPSHYYSGNRYYNGGGRFYSGGGHFYSGGGRYYNGGSHSSGGRVYSHRSSGGGRGRR